MEKAKQRIKDGIYSREQEDHRNILLGTSTLFLLTIPVDIYYKEDKVLFFTLLKLFIFILAIAQVYLFKNKSLKKISKLSLLAYQIIFNTMSSFMILATHDSSETYIFLFYIFMTMSTLLSHIPTKKFTLTTIPPLLIFLSAFYTDIHNEVNLSAWTFRMALTMGLMLFIHHNVFKFYRKHYKYLFLTAEEQTKNLILHEDKGELVKILCHDLNNGLAAIDMSSEIMQHLLKKPEVKTTDLLQNIERIKKAVKNQKEMIDNVKLKEALEAGKYEIKLSPVNLEESLNALKESFKHALDLKKINLNIYFLTSPKPWIMAEPISLRNQVFNNLVSNAIKFSPEESKIDIYITEIENKVLISIKDYGIGMEEELIKNLFNPNVKTTRPGIKGEKGTGFGLPLAKSYLNSYDSSIVVDSEINNGSKFTMTFQKATAPHENEKPTYTESTEDYE